MHSAATVNGGNITAGLYTFESYPSQIPDYETSMGMTRGNLSFWIVDVTGYGGGVYVEDYTPAALNWANVSLSTTSHTGTAANPKLTVSGIDQTITLEVGVGSPTGNLTTGTFRMMKWNGGSPVTLGTRSFKTPGTFSANVVNGDEIYFEIDATTASGIRSGGATIIVRNVTDNNHLLDSYTLSATVDSDNNYNLTPDVTPAAINWTNIVENTDDLSGFAVGYGNTPTITGIETAITLQLSTTDWVVSGSGGSTSSSGSIDIFINGFYVNGLSNGTFGADPTQSVNFVVDDGDTVQFIANVSVSDSIGYATGGSGGTFTVKNVSDGNATLDTFSISVGASTSGGA